MYMVMFSVLLVQSNGEYIFAIVVGILVNKSGCLCKSVLGQGIFLQRRTRNLASLAFSPVNFGRFIFGRANKTLLTLILMV